MRLPSVARDLRRRLLRAARTARNGAAVAVSLGCLAAPSTADTATEILAVWIQDDDTPFAQAFAADHLPSLRSLAEELGVEFRVLDARDGAPEEVVSTPLITFVNERGRSIYQGRYTTLDRVRTFVRTMRFVPQGDEPLVRRDVLSFPYRRATLVVPVKVTPLEGARPADHDDAAFEREMREGLSRGLRRLAVTPEVEVGRGDRLFYFDVHPWRSDDGELYVSAAVFSHFQCKEPIFTTYDEPHHGPWDARDAILARVGDHLEHTLDRSFDDVASGDAFRAVGTDVPTVSWADVGLEIERGASIDRDTGGAAVDFAAIANWRIAESPPGFPPALQFRFPAPLDNWVGEATTLDGQVNLGAEGLVDGATGYVEVDLTSVTFGEPDLDDALQGRAYLHTTEHPRARFQLDSMSAPPDPLTGGRQLLGEAMGTFRLKGVEIPLALPLLVEPFVDGGAPRLTVTGRFTIALEEPFGIQRAEGPAPANNTLIVDLSLVLGPAVAITSP